MNNNLASVPAMALVRNNEQSIGLVYWRVNESLGLDESFFFYLFVYTPKMGNST